MSSWDPEKLSVRVLYPANAVEPVIGRKYTLTHSDETGELFLDIGYVYNDQAINWEIRDEVLAEWRLDPFGHPFLLGKAYVDQGEFSEDVAAKRFEIFNREMRTALTGMVRGDKPFFNNYNFLLEAPIYIQFQSTYPQFQKILYYGTIGAYQ